PRRRRILRSGADGASSGPGGVAPRAAQLPSRAQERSQEERAAEYQMNKSVAHGTAGEVESWNAIERTDVPERGVKRLEAMAGRATRRNGERSAQRSQRGSSAMEACIIIAATPSTATIAARTAKLLQSLPRA